MILSCAFFGESSSSAIQTLTSHAGNLRKTDFKDAVADTSENLQPEDKVFWKRALSMSTDLAFFDTSAVDSGSCGNSCSSDSDCSGICMTCYGIVPEYNPTGHCGSQDDYGETDSTDNVDQENIDSTGDTSSVEWASCGNSCSSDSDCGDGICMTCYGIVDGDGHCGGQ